MRTLSFDNREPIREGGFVHIPVTITMEGFVTIPKNTTVNAIDEALENVISTKELKGFRCEVIDIEPKGV